MPKRSPEEAQSWAGHVRATVVLALPLIGLQLAQMTMGVTDTVMLGWLGAPELAAGILGSQAFFLVYIFGVGFSQAMMPLAAGAEGAGDARGVRRSIRMGLWVLALYSVLVMLPLWHTESILLALGQRPEIAALAGDYMRVVQWSMLPALAITGIRAYLTVVGRAYLLLAVIAAGAVLNGVLNYALIFGNFGAPALGIVGAAVATAISNLLMARCCWPTPRAPASLARYELYARFWRPDWDAFTEILRLGWPIGATIIAEVGLFATVLDHDGVARDRAAGGAWHRAAARLDRVHDPARPRQRRHGPRRPRVRPRLPRRPRAGGQHRAGARDRHRAERGARSSGSGPSGWSASSSIAENPTPRRCCRMRCRCFWSPPPSRRSNSLQAVASGILRGVRDTRVPMVIAVFSYWGVGLPVAWVLGFGLDWGGVGVWSGLAFGLAVAALLLNARFRSRPPRAARPLRASAGQGRSPQIALDD